MTWERAMTVAHELAVQNGWRWKVYGVRVPGTRHVWTWRIKRARRQGRLTRG